MSIKISRTPKITLLIHFQMNHKITCFYNRANKNLNQNEEKQNSFFSFVKSNTLSFIAIIISSLSIWYSICNYRDASTKEVIDDVFKIWHDADKINISDWQTSHLSAPFADYYKVRNNIHAGMFPIDKRKKSEFIIKERAFATFVLDQFDKVCYLYQQAQLTGNKSEAEYLHSTIIYITKKELRNPRMLYLWDKNGGDLCSLYEDPTVSYYNTLVLEDSGKQVLLQTDTIGPFYIDPLKNEK